MRPLNIYAYIEYVTEYDGQDIATVYRWGLSGAELDKNAMQIGTEEALFEWLTNISHPIVLIIPGARVVTQQVPYSEKEKRYFEKMLPYSLEDAVIDDVDTLHFVQGKIESSHANVAYIDKQWFDKILRVFAEKEFFVHQCIADFQKIQVQDNETVFWLTSDTLYSHSDDGQGFTCSKHMMEPVLSSVLLDVSSDEALGQNSHKNGKSHKQYHVYISDCSEEHYQHEQDAVTRIFHTLAPEAAVNIHYGEPVLSLDNPQAMNLCCGPYQQKKPVAQQVKEYTWLGVLAVIALVFFVSVNAIDIYRLSTANNAKADAIQAEARKVIPVGNIQHNPVRQLLNKLGSTQADNSEPSQVVYLLSHIAPVIQALDINLSTINYSDKEKVMRLNIQADSFNQVEKFRTNLTSKGLYAELISSNAVDNKFQARIRVSLEAR